jgi:hypothetical protein
MAEFGGVNLTDEERGIVGGLTGAILYAGRYPVPRVYNRWMLRSLEEPIEESNHFKAADFDAAEALADRLAALLGQACEERQAERARWLPA